MMKNKIILFVALCSFATGSVFAASGSFIVHDVQVVGAKHLAIGTVLNYFPLKAGDRYESAQSAQYINKLYQTGLFADIKLEQRGDTLIVEVVERPTISKVSIKGNDEIDKKKLSETLKAIGLIEGQIFNPTLADKAKNTILEQYLNLGYYGAKVEVIEARQSDKTVAITIKIHEGEIAKIKQVHIIGNEQFDEKTLLKEFSLGTPNLFSFITNNDRYAKSKLAADLENLRSFYLDRGFLRFQIDSTQVSLSPDKKWLYITIHVTEGKPYQISNIEVTGETIVPQKKLAGLVNVKPGTVFSRKEIMAATAAISTYLGNLGYANASVQVATDLDDQAHTVSLRLIVVPGKKIYARRISFVGNLKTEDDVLRREILQQEGSLISVEDLQESARRLRLLDYFKDVKVTSAMVPGAEDQMDVLFNVTEVPSAKASIAVGYGNNGFVFNLGFNQDNFLGTGKTVGFDFSNDIANRVFSLYYNNPYYTPSGVSRSFNIYSERTTPGSLNGINYRTDQHGIAMTYGLPVAKDDHVSLGIGFDRTLLHIGDTASNETVKFVNRYGDKFNQLLLTMGWSHNGLDRSVFPTQGFLHSIGGIISAPTGVDNLTYYKFNYHAQYFLPLFSDFILHLRGHVGYGDGYGKFKELPFFKNYYAGGMGSVRGYQTNSLGPRDWRIDGNGELVTDTLGGNLLLTGTVGLIIPQPFSENLRTIFFVDAGNVFNTHADVVRKTNAQFLAQSPLTEGKFDLSQSRASAGIEVNWRSPFGQLVFSLAKPLNAKPGDEKEAFQFTIGTSY